MICIPMHTRMNADNRITMLVPFGPEQSFQLIGVAITEIDRDPDQHDADGRNQRTLDQLHVVLFVVHCCPA